MATYRDRPGTESTRVHPDRIPGGRFAGSLRRIVASSDDNDAMNSLRHRILRRRIRLLLLVVMAGLIVSGITAFPITPEIAWLADLLDAGTSSGAMAIWLTEVRTATTTTNRVYPFLFYGTDWLAFAHLVIALLFIGPLRDPLPNRWVVDWGLIACAAVLPLALIAGPLRGIPFFWQLIDCSFGIAAAAPLWLCRRCIAELEEVVRADARQHISSLDREG
jgi:hypothetical protein